LPLAGCGGAQARYTNHIERGKKYLTEDNLDKAGIEFRNALQIQPKDPEALYLTGRVNERRGNLRGAARLSQAAIDANPEYVPARAGLGKLYAFAGLPDRALQVVEPALAKHPDDADLLTVRSAARHQMKNDAGARADGERAVQLAPTNENAIALLAG